MLTFSCRGSVGDGVVRFAIRLSALVALCGSVLVACGGGSANDDGATLANDFDGGDDGGAGTGGPDTLDGSSAQDSGGPSGGVAGMGGAGAGERPTHPSTVGDRWVAIVSPTNAETFLAPTTLRLIAAAHDPNIATNQPVEGRGANAQKVQFFVDGDRVLEVNGANAEYWIFKGVANGIAAGTHVVWARAVYTNPALILDSAPMTVTVNEPAAGRTVTLDADVVLTGDKGFEIVGTPETRVRLEGNGHRIISDGEATGPLTLKYVDVVDLGSRTIGIEPGVQIATSGPITIEDSTFDTSNTIDVTMLGEAPASVRRNLFRSNMRMPLGQNPGTSGTSPSYPVIRFTGPATGAKVFASNNVAAGWVQFDKTSGWIVGGDTDNDSNVLIGPRVGIWVQESDRMQVRRNYSHHAYYGGWSQGSNFELGGTSKMIVEHNVIYGSSWPVRGAGCEFRYNLVADAGHQFIWADNGGAIHHNVFTGGQSDIASIYLIDQVKGVRVYNNTVDGQMNQDMVTAVHADDKTTATLTSNAFVNVPVPQGLDRGATVTIIGGQLTADFNAFADTQPVTYSDGRRPQHDIILASPADARFTNLPKNDVFDADETAVWQRVTTVREILGRYRARYAPQAGSPLIDSGDPAEGPGNDIGAVGAGAPSDTDKFGKL